MSDSSDRIDQLFRNQLERHDKNPGDKVWEEIDRTLCREEHLSYHRQKRKESGIFSVFLLLIFCLPLPLDRVSFKNGRFLNLALSGMQKDIAQMDDHSNRVAYIPFESLRSPKTDGGKNKNARLIRNDTRIFINSVSQSDVPIYKIANDRPVAINPLTGYLPKVDSGSSPVSFNASTRLKTHTANRISVTAYFTKDFAGYNFSDHDITGVNGKEIESRERNIFAASAGIYLNYRINRKWVVQSGISYSWSNNRIDPANSYAVKNEDGIVQFKFNTTSGYSFLTPPGTFMPVQGDSVSTAKTYTQLHYLNIPLVLSYKIPLGRFSILAGGGFTANVLTHAALQTVIYGHGYEVEESEIAIRGLKKVIVGLLVKVEFEYRFASKWAVEIIPSFRNTLSPVSLNTPVPVYPFNFGIGAGIHFTF